MADRTHAWLERIAIGTIALGFLSATTPLKGATVDRSDFDRDFAQQVLPFLESYCLQCHGKEKLKGHLDLRVYSTTESIAKDFARWDIVLEKLVGKEMPPEEAGRFPTIEQRQRVIDWIQAFRKFEAEKNAGDPGPVLARRLSNAEYDYTIRDLTGVDIRPTKEFPVDPANEAGFDNSGESLAMSPTLLKKYLEAARSVAEHIVLKPDGFVFAPFPVVTDPDRDKYAVRRVIDFYQRQSTNYADYFFAAWQFKNRAALGISNAMLTSIAAKGKISPKYLGMLWSTLEGTQSEMGPIGMLQAMWRSLPAPGQKQMDDVLRDCQRMRDFVLRLREKLIPVVKNLAIRGIAPGSQPFVLWKDRQFAANRMSFRRDTLQIQGDAQPVEADVTSDLPPEELINRALLLPIDEPDRRRYEDALEHFCKIFPDRFYVPERGLIFLKEDKESRGRLLSAGFHLMVGYFRDDAPLCELLLDDAEKRELDSIWREFHFVTSDPIRQYKDFIFFERAEPPRYMQGAEFDFARSEDKDSISAAKIAQLADAYLAKTRRNGGSGAAIQAIEDYFKNISAEIRAVQSDRVAAEPSQLKALADFAERAYRRPLSFAEREDLYAFYRSLRGTDGLSHEEAIRDSVASILVSPFFCYRLDLEKDRADLPGAGATGAKIRPLSDYDLASRLSYFLWSSMPDNELLARAAAGDLHRRDVLISQSRRMLRDDRIRGLATEFGANWLDFRRFEEHNAVDRERFKTFNNDLREAMFEEPIRFFANLVQENRPVLDLLFGRYTFVNQVLAKHYGMTHLRIGTNQWMRIDDADRFQRGGILPMSVFLTMNAPGLRTSPVKRGYWVVRRVLGERIPPPPPKVPELPSDESKLGNLTLREMLAKHREDKSCAACHERFDSFGLVFEGFGPIGERRVKDLGDHPVDTHAIFPGGGEGTGVDGLRAYLRDHRQDEFLDNFCRKLLSYALGRSLLLSDDATIRGMREALAANGNRFGSLVECIVTSPQFLNKRAPNELTKK